jgi:hypothetical protein
LKGARESLAARAALRIFIPPDESAIPAAASGRTVLLPP